VQNPAIERIFREWHQATKDRDIEKLMSLYAEDAVFESPTATLVLHHSDGIIKGRAAIGELLREVYRKLASGKGSEWYRTGAYHTDGKSLVWEYPRETPSGQQPEILEVMEIEGDHISRHRVYWGWYGLSLLQSAT
jgi:hypothetical protein